MKLLAIAAVTAAVVVGPVMAEDLPACNTPGITPPKPANSHIAEDYPPVSLALGEQGITVVQFTVTPEGTATSATVVKSSGSMRLDQASLDEILGRWRYTPALSADSKPIACTQKAQVRWVLDGNTPAIPEQLRAMAVKMKPADYPEGARTRREQGLVLLMINAGPNGKHAIILVSSGHPELDVMALRIVTERINQSPADFDGHKVDTMAILPVLWSLDDAPPSGK